MPRFHVVETFTLESRQLFVLSGSIVEGEVRSGMFLSVSSASGPAKTVRIHSLEFVRRPGGVEDLCLCVECAESEDLDRWRSLDIAGQTREVMADGPDQRPLARPARPRGQHRCEVVLHPAGAERSMRVPTLQSDFWQLCSGEESHRKHPETFWIPPEGERQTLKPGQAAKLIFEMEVEEDGVPLVQRERMWVVVAERVGDLYIGILDNKPASFEPSDQVYLCFGAEIPFAPEHVIDIADPPGKYADWQLSQKPERHWPRD